MYFITPVNEPSIPAQQQRSPPTSSFPRRANREQKEKKTEEEKGEKDLLLTHGFYLNVVSSMLGPAFFPSFHDDQESSFCEERERERRNEIYSRIFRDACARLFAICQEVDIPVLKEKFQAQTIFRCLDSEHRGENGLRARGVKRLSLSLSLVTSRLLKVSPTVALKASDKKKSFGIMVIRYSLSPVEREVFIFFPKFL